MPAAKTITAERLRKLLAYDPETGVFRWKVQRGRVRAGSIGGTLIKSGCHMIAIDWRTYPAHRLAWLCVHGCWPVDQIDHVNGIRTDNRIANLREAIRNENNENIEHYKTKTLTQKIVREFLDYCPTTGHFTWKWRERKWFKSEGSWKRWNKLFAGKRAFPDSYNGYHYGILLNNRVPAHRLAFLWMTGRYPYPIADHINGIGTDNRWSNLREATHTGSAQNTKRQKTWHTWP
jgi:hypothetical protein